MASLPGEDDVSVGINMILMDQNSSEVDELRETIRHIWLSKELSDFTLCAGDQEFQVHRLVLFANAAFFKNLPCQADRWSLPDHIPAHAVEKTLMYLYEGHLEVREHEVAELKVAAEYLGVKKLKAQCEAATGKNVMIVPTSCPKRTASQPKEKPRGDPPVAFNRSISADRLWLPLEEFIGHQLDKDPRGQAPDEAMFDALTWASHVDEDREHHLGTLLELLPLTEVQEVHLKQALKEPVVKRQPLASRMLQSALDALRTPSPGAHDLNVSLKSPRANFMVVLGHSICTPRPSCFVKRALSMRPVRKGSRLEQPSNEVYLVGLDKGVQSSCLGTLEAEFVPEGVQCCVDGGQVYIGGLGYVDNELWQLGLHDGKQRILCHFVSPRRGHAMCWKNNLLYIFCGSDSKHQCTSSVEAYNPWSGACSPAGTLMHYHILDPDHGFTNLVCCPLEGEEDGIIVCGAFPSNEQRRLVTYQHTVQLYSTKLERTTHSITLSTITERPVCGMVLLMKNRKVIVFCRDYTVVCFIDDIIEGRNDRCAYRKKYIVPNHRCAVVLTSDKQYVIVLGGQSSHSSIGHFIYRAKVEDILKGSGNGWERMDWDWPIGSCHMYGYDTVTMATE